MMNPFKDILARHANDEPAARVAALKAELVASHDEIRQLVTERTSGRRVVRRITRMTDDLLTALYDDADARHAANWGGKKGCIQGVALAAIGGYGRGELNPHSDIDILVLYEPHCVEVARAMTNELVYPLWDMRFAVGHSVRTVVDCIEIGLGDLTARTAMMESRFLTGDEGLYQRFVTGFGKKVMKRGTSTYLAQKAEEQRARHERYGATVFLQQPNVKESPGGLRDIHYLIWAAIARYGTGSLKALMEQGLLVPQDYVLLVKAQGFFWRVRNALHFRYNKRADVLTFEEQLWLSEQFGFHDTGQGRGVERFMRRYYLYAAKVLDISSRFVDRATGRSQVRPLSRISARKVPPYFTATSRTVQVEPRKKRAFLEDGAGILALFHLAQNYGLAFDQDTTELLAHGRMDSRSFRTPEAVAGFMKILQGETGVAEALAQMHRFQVLGRIIPEFARVDRLVTFSQYHKYTVDAHTMNALSMLDGLRTESNLFGKVFREVRRKDVLFLAVLLHDAGKGQDRDHCVVGEEMAHEVGKRLDLGQDATELLAFLVREHLLMTHIAFRRDLSDEKVLSSFVRQVSTPERLRMLLILTHVDIRAVGPGTWGSWKEGLLTDLYVQAMEALSGRRFVMDMAETVRGVRNRISEQLTAYPKAWVEETLERLPGRYLVSAPVEEICRHLEMVAKLSGQVAQVEILPSERGWADITVCAHDSLVPGLFARIAGTLSAKDLNIYDARITTFRDDVILDVFRVRDPNMGEFIDHARWERIRQALLDVLEGRVAVTALFAGGRGKRAYENIAFSHTDPVVRIDNDTSDAFTVIDVFAADRQGLLYAITTVLAEQGLNIYFSRIATKADQVVDVFYVKNSSGKKVTDPQEIAQVRAALMVVLAEHQGVTA